MKRRRFVLLDRDGTIIVERHYLSDPRQIEFLPGAVTGLRHMLGMGLGLVVVTNQSAVGRGFFDEAHLNLIHRRLYELLEAEGIHLEGIYFCPHTSEDDCCCRKPRPGLIKRAAKELDFDLHASFVIGDKPADIELGRQVRATTFLVRTGYGAEFADDPAVNPHYVADDLSAAAQTIQSLLDADERRADP
jgi:histidinol-phosphate phosphatase family domain/HAD-superfamily hydrolase, subfamily IIIA